MSEDIKTAIIAGAVALVVAIITSIVTVISNKKMLNQSQHESKRIGITEKRMDWISNVRNLFAELFAYDFIDLYMNKDAYRPFNNKIQLINLYLNFSGELDKKILNLTNQLHETVFTATHDSEAYMPDYKDLNGTYERVITELQKLIHVYLKSEWNRVKFDSDPSNHDRTFKEVEEIEKLTKIYDDTSNYIQAQPERDAAHLRSLISQLEQQEQESD